MVSWSEADIFDMIYYNPTVDCGHQPKALHVTGATGDDWNWSCYDWWSLHLNNAFPFRIARYKAEHRDLNQKQRRLLRLLSRKFKFAAHKFQPQPHSRHGDELVNPICNMCMLIKFVLCVLKRSSSAGIFGTKTSPLSQELSPLRHVFPIGHQLLEKFLGRK